MLKNDLTYRVERREIELDLDGKRIVIKTREEETSLDTAPEFTYEIVGEENLTAEEIRRIEEVIM